MSTQENSRRIHPLFAGAAVAVIVASATAVAAMAGLLPSSGATVTPEVAMVQPPTPPAITAPVASTPAAPLPAPQVAQVAKKPAAKPAPQCTSCGRIEGIHPIKEQAQPSGLGMVAGAVIGGALGNQVGGGNGRKVATVAGMVGGGYAGNQIEKNTRGAVSYQVVVRMDNGGTRTVHYAQAPQWNVGDRVRVENGQITYRG